MIIALSQLNSTVGDLSGNAALIKDAISKAKDKADVLVFPEMALTGYPPKDLIFDSNFINTVYDVLSEISKNIFDIIVLVGFIRCENGKMYNSVAIIESGNIIGFRDKTLLPNHDVFDEKRYFCPANKIEPIEVKINNKKTKLGIQICEDLWDNDYDFKVTDILVEKEADIIINLSASPFYANRLKDRIEVVREKAKRHSIPYAYCNAIGYQEELVFDGQSFVMNASGDITALGKPFEEDLIIVNILSNDTCSLSIPDRFEELFMALSLGVKDYIKKTHHSKVVIGLSGGIDSALTAAIASNAIKKGADIIGVAMPSQFSSNHSIRDAELLAYNLGLNFELLEINDINSKFLDTLDPILDNLHPGLAEENLQARIRGNILMTIANKMDALLLNTGNKTELALGYCTLYGDMCGALSVISDLNKHEVYGLANWINNHFAKEVIPESSITKSPSAELSYNQVDPFNYDVVSPLVDDIITNGYNIDNLISKGYDYDLCKEIINRIRKFEYKRHQSAPGIRVSQKAFGVGRRYPIINQYKL